jgi:hypothetical protein
MGVGYINDIYNNTDKTWYFASIDKQHNGRLTNASNSSDTFVLDDHAFHALPPHTHYRGAWCGIPWYSHGEHYKQISSNRANVVNFYTTQIGQNNWIYFEENGTGRIVGRQSVPINTEFHCNMVIGNDGIRIDVVNNPQFSGEMAAYYILRGVEEWFKVAVGEFGAAVIEVAGG